MKETPKHVAIILDGNRRWAKEHNLTSLKGHQKGAENIKVLAKGIFERGIKYLSIFAFSTENFNRSQEEVDYLMNIFTNEFKNIAKDLNKSKIKIVFSGGEQPLREDVIETAKQITELTKDNNEATLNICLNYGGRNEIVNATKKIAKDLKSDIIVEEDINLELFDKYLYQDLPDIDIMIRTSGECRISNFMLWKLSYAELFFVKTYFPAFTVEEFDSILDEYMGRDRRFGGNTKE